MHAYMAGACNSGHDPTLPQAVPLSIHLVVVTVDPVTSCLFLKAGQQRDFPYLSTGQVCGTDSVHVTYTTCKLVGQVCACDLHDL